MAEEENENTSTAASRSESSSKNPLVTILLVLNMFALCAVAYFQYSFLKKDSEKPELAHLIKEGEQLSKNAAEEVKVVEKISKENLLALDPFTVNLAQGDGPRRFVRLNAVLKMSDESKSDEFEARKPQIRDTIIGILNSKRPEDLLKREGKSYLKEEIKTAINSYLIDGKVVDIFYIGFQIN